ncbi:hypothetical protein ONS95_001197 [Cadophora gregata]|uniref:uncharacterized protein n=1 Tax=Cadophora gregata TaxID=51156 RepID=UPI0026DAD50A|nr:uncharacterized protein ONS95_001197 [Cadophora gregata]KAK0129262.1 hypothetical protein ONS95_001197 [Cadophora gregata]
MLDSTIVSSSSPEEAPSPWRLHDPDAEQQHVGSIPGKIELQRMTQRSEIKDQEEDWTGKTSTTLRRKLQNRLNQRASRKRRKQLSTQKPQVFIQDIPSSLDKEPDLVAPINPTAYIRDVATRPKRNTNAPPPCIYNSTRRIITSTPSFSAFLSTPLPVDQKLMTLLHFNLVRALLQNVHILGLDPDLMEGDIPSPFQGSEEVVVALMGRLPEALMPTRLQLMVPHHPEVDGFPFPVLRDNFIAAGESFDTDEFCLDMLYGVDSGEEFGDRVGNCKGRSSAGNGRTGLIVWSDPWLSGSWEVDEGFARKYEWLLRGCKEIHDSTNFWRRSRGEPPLRFEEVDE